MWIRKSKKLLLARRGHSLPTAALATCLALAMLLAGAPALDAQAAVPQDLARPGQVGLDAQIDASVRKFYEDAMAGRWAPPREALFEEARQEDGGPENQFAAMTSPYVCLPTCSEVDGRFLSIASTNLNTLAGQEIILRLAVPGEEVAFELGIFDGDTSGTWDQPTAGGVPLQYTLYADPTDDGSGGVIVGQWSGATMASNAWFTANIATSPAAESPSGNYFYRLEVESTNPASLNNWSNFKIRTTGQLTTSVSVSPVAFAFTAPFFSGAEGIVIYPNAGSGDFTTTTYDGVWNFFLDVPRSLENLDMWDGDLDRGSVGNVDLDTDDPDTPGAPFLPPWALGTPARPEGVAFVLSCSTEQSATGCPADNRSATPPALFLRQPAIAYNVTTPLGESFANPNPSGNLEWEQFRISIDPFDRSVMDHQAAGLPAGVYQVDLLGVDLANLNAWRFFNVVLGVCEDGTPCYDLLRPFLVGDTVFLDLDGDGSQDSGEPGISGVTMELVDERGNVMATAVTGDGGLYLFPVGDGTYTVRVAASNFDVGGALEGLVDTTGTERTDTVLDDNVLTYDFGFTGTGSIGDLVWSDSNGDGVFDDGVEPGLSGVRVTLVEAGPDGAFGTADDLDFGEQLTDADGNYSFDELPPGNYRVAVDETTVPDGSVATTPNPQDVNLGPGEDYTDADFGYQGNGSIGDLVWLDADGDGVFDAGEAGISGVRVTLVEAGPDGILGNGDDVSYGEQLTDAAGNYTFGDLPAGTYRVAVDETTVPAGTAATTPNPQDVTLAAGEDYVDADFGYRGTGSIGDLVWLDIDGDGVYDSGTEPGLSGVRVTLVEAGPDGTLGTADDVSYGERITDGAGDYTFGNLPAGSYRVAVDETTVPAGTTATTPNPQDVTLAAGEDYVDADFGYQGTGSIGDLVWLDSDGDGAFDVGEPGLSGVRVTLVEAGADGTLGTADDVSYGERITDAAGDYTFGGLPAGSYRVTVDETTVPAGTAATTPNPQDVTLATGQDYVDADFGYRGTGSIGDLVWLDIDGDGVYDAGAEPGLSGVRVTLVEAGADGVLGTADDVSYGERITDGAGSYTFGSLPAGSYRVTVDETTTPPGTAATTPNPQDVSLGAGQSYVDADFGYQGLGSIGDLVWRDTDRDGIFDGGEAGLSGVRVTLVEAGADGTFGTADDIPYGERITDGAGSYTFGNLPAGSYRVTVDETTVPAGTAATTPNPQDVSLGAGEAYDAADFGYALPAPTDPVKPVLECVVDNGGGSYTAYFGYLNQNSGTVSIPVGPGNQFSPSPVDRGQPTVFEPGRTPFWPDAAFSVDFDGSNLVWKLNGRTATASAHSTPCSYHVFLEKTWEDSLGNAQAGPPSDLPAGFEIVASSDLGTAVCSYPSGSSTLECTYDNRSPATDDNGLWVPAGSSYTVTEMHLPPGYRPMAGTGTYTPPTDACVPGRDGIEKFCTHTVVNRDGAFSGSGDDLCAIAAPVDDRYASTGGHAIWLPGIGTDFLFTPDPGSHTEFGDGTARLTGTVRRASNAHQAFLVDIIFTGRQDTPPPGSPKRELAGSAYEENGGPIDTDTWHYYTAFEGTLVGIDAYAGAVLAITRTGPAYQVGDGASGKNLHYGSSAWFDWMVVMQPTGGGPLQTTGVGDVNIDLVPCDDGSDPPGTGTIGYWKNHPEAWPVDSIEIGGRTYTRQQALDLMKAPVKGDRTISLFKQLVAAKLNVAIGNDGSCVADTIHLADYLLYYFPPGSRAGSGKGSYDRYVRYYLDSAHEQLDQYNNGRLCAPHRG